MKHSRVQLKVSRFRQMAVSSLLVAQAVRHESTTRKMATRLASMQGDAVGVFAVSFHPNGTQLATGGFDGKIRIFDTATGKLLNAFMSVPIEPAGSEDVTLVVTGMT